MKVDYKKYPEQNPYTGIQPLKDMWKEILSGMECGQSQWLKTHWKDTNYNLRLFQVIQPLE